VSPAATSHHLALQEFFAIAGVTKRIKIYDYNVVLKDMVDIHYPR
jgi:E3 ubiquitin-protein ligase RFWD2